MIALQAMTPDALAAVLPELSLAEARKIVSAVHRGLGIFGPLPGVRRVSLEAVRTRTHTPSLALHAERRSALDPFVKFALKSGDGHVVETVRIPLERTGRYSVCVSSQVGCGLGCAFCATGRLGLVRNLESWEIVEQVRVVRASLGRETPGRVHGVVFQGMGEPLANLDMVLGAIRVVCEPSALAIDARNITVCTAGLPAGIRRLAREAPKVRLALSIASARGRVRRSLMPIEGAHPLGAVLDAVVDHARHTGLAPMWAVTLLAGVNDSDEDARAFATLALDFTERAGVRPRISLIAYNSIERNDSVPFRRSSKAREHAFRRAMAEAGVFAHRRYSGGSDVRAACGQLAVR